MTTLPIDTSTEVPLTDTTAADTRGPGPLTDAVLKIGVAVVLGWLATIVGAVMIIIGYLRVEASDTLAEQFAYFSSACIGGLALIGLGGLAVLSRQHADARRAVDEIRRRANGGSSARPAQDEALTSSSPARVALVPGSATFHLPDCVFVDRRPDIRLAAAGADEVRSMRPCQVCHPERR